MPRRASDVHPMVEAIRSGIPYTRLLEDFRLTAEGFRMLLQRLIAEEDLNPADLQGEASSDEPNAYDDTIFDAQSRRFERRRIDFALPVSDVDNPLLVGYIADLSKWGARISGIHCEVGEMREFTTFSHKKFYLEPVRFEGICRWTKTRLIHQTPTAGFEALEFRLSGFDILLQNIDALSESERTSITEFDWTEV